MFKISKTISLHPRLMLIIEKQLFLHHNIGNLILLLPKLLTSPRRLQWVHFLRLIAGYRGLFVHGWVDIFGKAAHAIPGMR